ncbi:hypothetical protein ADU59_18175 [Pararhizobium polonicum]|uniref:Uncharacterized protein n=1 Tax=Pararhizobium polonicum TaxID=1612624 RepID=A0A1C7NYR5_9HYPH|nr:hypothetical protein ADU59_18175 [Pararhizobium polonicum]
MMAALRDLPFAVLPACERQEIPPTLIRSLPDGSNGRDAFGPLFFDLAVTLRRRSEAVKSTLSVGRNETRQPRVTAAHPWRKIVMPRAGFLWFMGAPLAAVLPVWMLYL